MSRTDWKTQSELFDQAASYYDTFRPGYPEQIVETILRTAGINENSRLMEIGAGSGKATEPFAQKGLDVLCIDPGPELVRAGERKFAGFPRIRYHTGRFEEYPAPACAFDLIFSAQSFHWVPQPEGYEKCAFALKPGGWLALFWNMYVIRDNEEDTALLALSQKHGGFADFLSPAGCEERISSIVAQLEGCGLFHSPIVTRAPWELTYTAETFFGFVLTGNTFLRKGEAERQMAYADLRDLAGRSGGSLHRSYLCALYMAQKKEESA